MQRIIKVLCECRTDAGSLLEVHAPRLEYPLQAAEVLQRVGQLGRIQPGAIADLIAVDGDPLRDIGCLTGQGERIPLVVQGGVVRFWEG